MRNANPTRTSLLLALLATGVIAAGTLVAAPQDDGPVHIIHPMGGLLEKADANGDGNISQAEHDAMRAAHLAELDGNNDGFVTLDEQQAAREARAAERFLRHDKDGDGRVSVDELAERGEGRFERMDANGDGMLTAEEMKQGRRKFRMRDGHAGH